MAVNLTTFKAFISVDHNGDDAALTDILNAARETAVRRSNRTEEELISLGGGQDLPLGFQRAVYCLAAADWTQDEKYLRNAEIYLKDYRRLEKRDDEGV